jgi:hypothetical protein
LFYNSSSRQKKILEISAALRQAEVNSYIVGYVIKENISNGLNGLALII